MNDQRVFSSASDRLLSLSENQLRKRVVPNDFKVGDDLSRFVMPYAESPHDPQPHMIGLQDWSASRLKNGPTVKPRDFNPVNGTGYEHQSRSGPSTYTFGNPGVDFESHNLTKTEMRQRRALKFRRNRLDNDELDFTMKTDRPPMSGSIKSKSHPPSYISSLVPMPNKQNEDKSSTSKNPFQSVAGAIKDVKNGQTMTQACQNRGVELGLFVLFIIIVGGILMFWKS